MEALKPREREIARLVAQGKTNQEIAEALCLSVKTIKNALIVMYRVLKVKNRAGLATVWTREQ